MNASSTGLRLFEVQDPTLRAAIMPLFAIDTRDLSERPKGHGTTFRITPWGKCATAFHVIEDLLEPRGERAVLKEHIRLLALELEGIPYGALPIRPDQWRNFEGMFVLAGIQRDFGQPATLRNITELAALTIQRSPSAEGAALHLGLDLRLWQPTVGERVTAFGFADLDVSSHDDDEMRPISQELYGSSATIIDIEPMDPARGRPWPFFRVDRDWPGGMSGGPVVNAQGHVIGIVSTGVTMAATGSAVFFSGSSITGQMFPEIDPGAPGQIYCWGGFNEHGEVAMVAPSREVLDSMPGASELLNVGRISFNTRTGDYICVEN